MPLTGQRLFRSARRSASAGILTSCLLLASGSLMATHAVKAIDSTPPMGWNSYDCYCYGVTEAQVMANAHYLADNLKRYGWQYCIVDYIWWVPDQGAGYPPNQNKNWNFGNMDQYGRFMPDTTRFPSSKGGRGFKPLADSVHNLGLKFGIHLMRGVPKAALQKKCPIYNSTYTCTQASDTTIPSTFTDYMYGANMNNGAGQAYLNSILSLYSDWDVDFIKVDDLLTNSTNFHLAEAIGYANAIATVSRPIVFSTSPGPTPVAQAANLVQYANQWRLVADFWDNSWSAVVNAFPTAETWRKLLVNGRQISGPDHWLDVDMLPFGHLCLYGPPIGTAKRYSLSTLTKGQHKLIFFLWCINNGPLFWGGNLPDNANDPFYDSLTKNRDALFINQHGINGRVLRGFSPDSTPIWCSTHPADTTTKFLTFLNVSNKTVTMSVSLDSLGITGTVPVRDVWSGQSLGNFTTTFSQSITARNAGLYIVGNGPTGTVPVRNQTRSMRDVSGQKLLFTTAGRLTLPASLAGKAAKVSVFNLKGKLLTSTVTRDRSVTIDAGKLPRHGNQMCLVSIQEVK